jgi:hypothetical protein
MFSLNLGNRLEGPEARNTCECQLPSITNSDAFSCIIFIVKGECATAGSAAVRLLEMTQEVNQFREEKPGNYAALV